jgi:hypothetical protein
MSGRLPRIPIVSDIFMKPQTAAHVSKEIKIAQQSIEATRAKIEELEAELEAYIFMVKMLEEGLQQAKSQNSQGSLLPDDVGSTSITPGTGSMSVSGSPPSMNTSAGAPIGLRDGIRTVLRDANGHGMKGRDVAQALTSRGIHINGTTNLIVRVSTELYRLKQLGHVRKRGSLYYAADSMAGGG